MTHATKRILIAEDQRPIAADLERTLRTIGFEVAASVTSGQEAVDKAIELRPDLALLDIRLPGGMDGIDAATAIRERVDVPIVYLTAYADEETVRRAMVTGPFGYLVKPINERELRAAIEIAVYKHDTDRLIAHERARRQAAEELELFVEGVEDYGIFLLDASGHVASWNAGAERTKGYRAEEILGKHLSVFYVPEDVAAGKPRANLEAADRDGRAEDEGWRVRKDGARFWASVVTTALRDDDGRLRGFGKIVRDVTASRRADQALRASEKRKEAILNASFDAVITIDHLGNIVELNRAAERTFDLHREDAIGKEMASLIIPERLRERHRRGIARYLETGVGPVVGTKTELPVLRADGTELLAEIAIEVIHPDGPPLFTGFIRDISEQRREEARREVLLEATSILASSLDSETALGAVSRLIVPRIADHHAIDLISSDGRLQRVGVAHAGAGAGSLGPERVASPRFRSGQPSVVDRVLTTGESELIERVSEAALARLANDRDHLDTLRQLDLRSFLAAPIRTIDGVAGVISVATSGQRRLDRDDLTFVEQLAGMTAIAIEKSRLFREAQRQRRAAEEAVRARDAFLSVASHELRNPLSTLQLSGDLLERDPQRAAEVVPRMGRQIRTLTKLVNNLLDASRITAGRLEMDYEQVDLGAVVREVVARLEPDIVQSGCNVSMHAGTPVVGRWDVIRVDQIATNLLSNAVKYGAGEPIDIVIEGGDDHGRLVVRDHGVGIPPEDQARIFERFERVTKGAARVGGFGLGLWIVREIVSALGGSVTVTSELGEGSTFIVDLPYTPPVEMLSETAQALEDASELQAGEPQSASVLVVVNDPDDREMICSILRDASYAVASAANGLEALDILRDGAVPRVILLDLAMPVMDGTAFLHQRDHASELAAIPVVLLSDDGQPTGNAEELNVAGRLTRPIEAATLLSMVDLHCRLA